jgi:hypothetical protein
LVASIVRFVSFATGIARIPCRHHVATGKETGGNASYRRNREM